MRSLSLSLFAVGASAARLTPRAAGDCCFGITVSGGVTGPVGQISDGQNRVGPSAPAPASYCLSSAGGLTDSSGRGCILTPPTTQFQCDSGASPTLGFSVGPNGVISYNGSPTFYACQADASGSYNIYTTTTGAQTNCKQITLTTTNGACVPASKASSAPSPPPSSQPPPPPPPPQPTTVVSQKISTQPGTTQIQSVPVPVPTTVVSQKISTQPGTTQVKSVPVPTTIVSQKVSTQPGTTQVKSVPVPTTVTSIKTVPATCPAPRTVTTTCTETAPPVTVTSIPPAVTVTSVPPPVTATVTAPPVTAYVTAPPVTSIVTAPPVTNTVTVTAPPTTITPPARTVSVTVTAPAPPCSSVPVYPSGSQPAPSKPVPSQPAPSQPAPSKPVPSQPAPSQPVSSKPPVYPSGTPPASSKPVPSPPAPSPPAPPGGGGCPGALTGSWEFPHLIVPIDSSAPNKAYGTQYFGSASSTNSSLFNFDIPASYAGRTCTLVFYLPTNAQLETSSITSVPASGGSLRFDALSGPASQASTYGNAPAVAGSLGTVSVAPGNAYRLGSAQCAAGKTVGYKISSVSGYSLTWFQDYNPCPVGLYVLAS